MRARRAIDAAGSHLLLIYEEGRYPATGGTLIRGEAHMVARRSRRTPQPRKTQRIESPLPQVVKPENKNQSPSEEDYITIAVSHAAELVRENRAKQFGKFIAGRIHLKDEAQLLLKEILGLPDDIGQETVHAIRHLLNDAKSDTPNLARRINENAASGTGSWVERVNAARATAVIPEAPPALWAQDKQPGDTPPTFIKRHYGEYLRSDATGLTRPDIKRLDPQLYTALANWLRKNELPEECPLPTKSEALSHADVTPRPPAADDNTRAYWRAASRESYAKHNNKNLK
jgi:hypothetical protein